MTNHAFTTSDVGYSDLDPKRLEALVRVVMALTDPAAQARFLEDECQDQPTLRAAVEAVLALASHHLGRTPPVPSHRRRRDHLIAPAHRSQLGARGPSDTVSAIQPTSVRMASQSKSNFCHHNMTLSEIPLQLKAALDSNAPTCVGLSASLPDPPPVLQLGSIVAARYRLMGRLGEGGMGEVWKAEQLDPVKRLVALKFIKCNPASETVLVRFEAERQALAMMDHPHVAKVLDAGTTDHGAPFFVMEYVDGVSLTEYCDSRKLSIPQRLELFVTICAAVQHAHHKGIVHRDLKPSNILVAESDGKPAVKVIDFGLVKALNDPNLLTDDTIHTHAGVMLGTLLYMSPEQARAVNPHDVDTRADVYSLGVILYELLTGTTPIERGRLGPLPLEERRRIIIEEEPSRPSARLRGWDSLCEAASSRGIEPSRLGSILKGDLDWVVMKALEKERHHRYETVNALSRDVQRFLANEPVEARLPSGTYRLKKFARRYRLQVTALALVLLALAIGMAGTTYGLLRASRARDAEAEQRRIAQREQAQAELQRRRAELEAATASAVKEFVLKEMLRFADAHSQAQGRWEMDPDLKVRDVLRRASESIEGSFKDPLVEAEVRHTIGSALVGVGEARLGLVHLERADELYETRLGKEDPRTLAARASLAWALKSLGDPSRAIPIYEEVLERRRARLGDDHPDTLESLAGLGYVLLSSDDPSKAIPWFEDVLAMREAGRLNENDLITLGAANGLASAYLSLGQPTKAVPWFERAWAGFHARMGSDHPDTLHVTRNLGVAYGNAGDFARAIPMLEQALAGFRVRMGVDHPDTSQALSKLAWAIQASGDPARASALFEEALVVQRVKPGADHPDTLGTLSGLASAYVSLGQPAKAVPLFEEALAGFRARLGDHHPDTLQTLHNLGWAFESAGDFAQALRNYEQVLEKRRQHLGDRHFDTIQSYAKVAYGYHAQGRSAEAVPLFERALAGFRATRGADHPDTLHLLHGLGWAYKSSGRPDKAIPIFEQALAGSRLVMGEDDPTTLGTLGGLAWSHRVLGDVAKAIPFFEELQTRSRRKLGPDDPFVVQITKVLDDLRRALPAPMRDSAQPGSGSAEAVAEPDDDPARKSESD